MTKNDTKNTHYYKISNADKLSKLIPQLDKLIRIGDYFYGRSDTPVEPGIICHRFQQVAEVSALKDAQDTLKEDLDKVPEIIPEAHIITRGWTIHDLPSKSKDYESMDTDCGDLDEIIPDTILTGVSRGDVASLVSAGGLGKSFLTLQTLVNMACGRETFLTSKPVERNVVYLSLEDSMLNVTNRYKRVFKRMVDSELAKGDKGLSKDKLKWKMKRNLHVYALPLVLIDSKGNEYSERILELLQNIQNIDLLVIDTARRIQDLNENDSGQMSSFLRLLEAIGKELNCATLLLHHSSKSGTLSKAQGIDVGASVARGSGAIVDNGRGTWIMCKLPKKDAEELGIDDEHRSKYVLLEHEKCNFEKAQPKRVLERTVGGLLDEMVPLENEDEESSDQDEKSVNSKSKRGGAIWKTK